LRTVFSSELQPPQERHLSQTKLIPQQPHLGEAKDLSDRFFESLPPSNLWKHHTIGEVIDCCALKDFVVEEQKTSFFLGRGGSVFE
jgi:hypothetical protein